MAIHLKNPLVPLILQFAAFWPVWRWYAARFADSSDDRWGWVALVTAALMLIRNTSESGRTLMTRVQRIPTDHPHQSAAPASSAFYPAFSDRNLLLPALLTLGYALSYPFLSPLPRALFAMATIGATLSVYCFRSTLQFSFCGLLLLSLPLMASLQFYLGFPLRATVAAIAAPLLQLGGLAVIREGTCLNWNGVTVSVDAPCSGIKMLWTGLYLTFTLAWYFRLNTLKTMMAAMFSFIAILLGNTLRAVALFYLEAGIVNLPDDISGTAHSTIGVMMFLITALAIGYLVIRLRAEPPVQYDLCEPSSSSLSAAR